MDDDTRDGIYETISHVLLSQKVPMVKRKFLKRKLNAYKHQLRRVSSDKVSKQNKKRQLVQLGGGPMTYVLNAAIPLLLSYFAR